jgi:hypothetical protein
MIRKILSSTCSLVCLVVFSLPMVGSGDALDAESIQGAWLFDEENGNDVLDSSGRGRDGGITGADVKRVDGKFGDALEFFAGGKVEVPHADGFTTPIFTLMAWINVEKATGVWQLIVGKDNWPNRNYAMFVHKDSGVLHYAFCAPGGQDVGNINTPTVVTDGEWHHVAMTYDLKMRRAYIDGIRELEAALDAEPCENLAVIEIGRNYTGIIDEVLIANEPFSEDDIRKAMDFGLEKFILGGAAVSASGKLASTWGSLKR